MLAQHFDPCARPSAGAKTRELEERTVALEAAVAEMRQQSEQQHGASEGSVAELRTLVRVKTGHTHITGALVRVKACEDRTP